MAARLSHTIRHYTLSLFSPRYVIYLCYRPIISTGYAIAAASLASLPYYAGYAT